MTDCFIVKPLALNKINQAYALVRTVRPELTADGWRAVASGYLAEEPSAPAASRGVVAVQNDQGYIVGLFCYAVCDDMRHGATLRVENLTALDLFNEAGVMDALLREVDAVGRRLACRAVLADPPAGYSADSESGRRVARWFSDAADGRSGLLRLLEPPPLCATVQGA